MAELHKQSLLNLYSSNKTINIRKIQWRIGKSCRTHGGTRTQ